MSGTPAYTCQGLEAMNARELDVAVAEVVMGFTRRYSNGFLYSIAYLIPPDYPSVDLSSEASLTCELDNVGKVSLDLVPDYSSSWSGFGLVVERMQALGWTFDVDATAPELGIDVCFCPKNPAFKRTGTGTTLPRAAAIAAVLAVQGAA